MNPVLLAAGAVVAAGVVHRPGWIEIEDDRVIASGSGEPPRPPDRSFPDGFLVPGFVDIHVHGGGGASYTGGDQAQARIARAAHLAHGTTTSVASLVSSHPAPLLDQVKSLAELVEAGELAGIHLEGPWLAAKSCGAHDPTALRPPDLAELRAVLDAGRGTVRMATLAPELPGALDAIRMLADSGVVVAVGHTQASYDQTRAAIAAGATVATHLFNAMRPINHREPGPITALLEDPDVIVELILDGVHIHPAIHRFVLATAGARRIALVTDAMAAAGMQDGPYELGILPVTVVGGIARVEGSSTIAGSTATGALLFRNAFAAGGGASDDALLGAVAQTSTVPAHVLRLPPTDLRVGGRADLVVLSAGLEVELVVAAGRPVTMGV